FGLARGLGRNEFAQQLLQGRLDISVGNEIVGLLFRNHVHENQARLEFLGQGNHVGSGGAGLRAEICGIEDLTKLATMFMDSARMRSNGEHRAGDRAEYFFRDRAQKKLPESGAPARADYHKVRIVLLDRGSQARLDVAFLDQDLRADSSKGFEKFLAVLL